MVNWKDNKEGSEFGAGSAIPDLDWDILERDVAWQVEPRPVPEWLKASGPPLGHIAFMGDFEPRAGLLADPRATEDH